MLENPADELYFGEVYRTILQEAWLPEGAEVWQRTGKSRRGRRPTQQGLYPHSPTQDQSIVRVGFSMCAAAWRELPWETPGDAKCDGRWGREYWKNLKDARGVPCSYYDLFMRYCMTHYMQTHCIMPSAYFLKLTASLDSIDCNKFYPLTASNKCGRLWLTDGEGFYSEPDGWKFWPCCNEDPQIGYEKQTMDPGESQSLWVIDPETGEPGKLQFTDHNKAVGCIEYGKDSMYTCEYTWELISGGGTLSPTKGLEVTYTAPATNPNCTLNPTIRCSTTTASSTITLGINYYTGDEPAYGIYKYPDPCSDPGAFCSEGVEWYIPEPKVLRYRCDGTLLDQIGICSGANCVGELCTCGVFQSTCAQIRENCQGDAGYYWGQYQDLRTQDMIDQGCCPGPIA